MPFEDIAKTFTRKALPESEVELVGEVPAEALAPYREQAIKHIADGLELPGFRKGHVPIGIALQKVGEIGVLEEAVEIFIRDFYPALLAAHSVDAVGRPNIRITNPPAGGAPGNPVGISVRAAVYPEVTLPKDWQTLAEKFPLEAYTGELPNPLRQLADGGHPPPEPARPDDSGHSGGDEQKARDYMARDKRRGKIIDALLEKTTVAVPSIFVESELEKIMAQMKEDVNKFWLKPARPDGSGHPPGQAVRTGSGGFEDYLKQMQKTEAVVRAEFRAQARKRAVLQLALNKLADDEKVVADPAAVEKEVKHALEHFPDARPELVRIHIETVLRNEQVLKLLEGETK